MVGKSDFEGGSNDCSVPAPSLNPTGLKEEQIESAGEKEGQCKGSRNPIKCENTRCFCLWTSNTSFASRMRSSLQELRSGGSALDERALRTRSRVAKHADTVWDIPYSFGPDSFVEPDINVHIWNPISFMANFGISLFAGGALFLKSTPLCAYEC
ncbi:hypothetical protein TREES_T100014386 [Tupaia chinensis]|uniref:Uncharacterized protein n=1 Tax=Tupaia chinensis TaxID=246437 RepID=L9JAM8_TUPCH|nr:hypothetical protein TREES_T100014386 [Tupaia chinensis]